MVNWQGVEDAGLIPTRVWLSRTKESGKDKEEWQPLRKVDCQALNENMGISHSGGVNPVLIEGGRATADPEFGVIRYNFVARPLRALTFGTWFVVEEYKKNDGTSTSSSSSGTSIDPAISSGSYSNKVRPVLTPLPEEQAQLVEDLYQRAIYAASSLGEGIDPILKERIPLEGPDAGDYHVEVYREGGNHYRLRKSPNGWFGKSYDLQRGYGAYKVEGEEEELSLGPVGHVVFVVHGIGEAMFSRDDFTLAPSLMEHMERTRLTVQRRQVDDWKKKCQLARKNKQPEPDPPRRVEFLPITWYDQIHSSSNDLIRSLNGVTLSTIPALRAIANDVILDVLLYLTPNYCFDVLESVTGQIIAVYGVFTKTFPNFEASGGKASLVGHSLGSVICWDLLSLLKDSKDKARKQDGHGAHLTTADNAVNINYAQFASPVKTEDNSGDEKLSYSKTGTKEGAWGPALPKAMDKVLPFTPEFTMFLGSPIGLFLSLRGAHGVFDAMRDNSGAAADAAGPIPSATPSPFTLPSRSIYNIFSPSDPVAYRIEPLLLPLDTPKSDIPEPIYLTRLGQDVRFHVKAMQLSDEITKAFSKKRDTMSSFFTSITEHATTALTQIEATTGGRSSKTTMMDPASSPSSSSQRDGKKAKEGHTNGAKDQKDGLLFPLGGRSFRVDYQLQPRVIDNEYISAVTAHSSYFQNTDVLDFVVDLVDRRGEEEVIDLTNESAIATSMDYKKTD